MSPRSDMSPTRVTKRTRSNGATVAQDHRDELLPGIPHAVVLHRIAPKLRWRDFRVLSKVSTPWRQAIQDHEVYDVRVRLHATETFIVVALSRGFDPRVQEIFLCSMRELRRYEVPPVAHLPTGIPLFCQLVSLNGKIYALGGTQNVLDNSGSKDVYVMDLAGHQWHWDKCAEMHEPRLKFSTGVMDGKIFAFGGVSNGELIGGCEVYDPNIDAWSRIKPMLALWFLPRICAVGKEFLVYGAGRFDCREGPVGDASDSSDDEEEDLSDSDDEAEDLPDSDYEAEDLSDGDYEAEDLSDNDDDDAEDELVNPDEINDFNLDETFPTAPVFDLMRGAGFVEAYDPVKDEWRVVERLERARLDESNVSWLGGMHYRGEGGDSVTAFTMSL